MANTVLTSGPHIEVKSISSAYTVGVSGRLYAIQFNPGAASDELTVRSASNSGAVIFYAKCSGATDQRIKYFDGIRAQPHFDPSSGCTFTGATVLITMGG